MIDGTNYVYDYLGNLTTDPDGRTFTYNDDNLMASATENGTTVNYTWDASSQRLKIAVGSDEWKFVYDPTASVPSVLVAIDDTDAESFYVRGPGGGLLTEVTSGGTKYYHFNDLGSTVLVTNGSGSATNALAYSAWGTKICGGTQKPYNYVGEYGYYSHTSGQVLDDLRQLGVRYYDAETGRFTQRDPAYDGINYYIYAGSNPMVYIDPWGEALTSIDGAMEACIKQPTPLKVYNCLKDLKDIICECYGKKGAPSTLDKAIKNAWGRLKAKDALTHRAGKVRKEFPKEFLEKTIDQLRKIAKGKGETARKAKKALKLLNDGRDKFCK